MPSNHALRRRFFALAIPLLFSQACFQMNACDFDECESDADCPDGALCAAQGFSLGLSCVEAIPCDTDGDCPDGGTCLPARAEEPDHPFESGLPERGICDCDGWFCERDGSESSSSTSETTSSSSSAGEGGGVSGTGGAPGAGGGELGGAGPGAGGQGGAR
jgi:hypothetical protein